MEVYIEQLERLKQLKPHLLFPSHGPVIAQPTKIFDRYISHRQARHQRVLDAVKGVSSLTQISIDAYADTPNAHPGLAEDQTLSHLLVHERNGAVQRCEGGWMLIDKPPQV
jgi:glyoxylase-like metal-dependent hydrolase (beta-lactamase superfamily II)